MQPVLVVDPDRASLDHLVGSLRDEYVVTGSEKLDWRVTLAERHRWKLLIIDAAAMDDFRYARLGDAIRLGGPPILVTFADHDENEVVAILDAGAVACITKPFSKRELRARVRAILRRNAPAEVSTTIRFDAGSHNWSLDDQSRRLFNRSGQQVELSPQEYHLLRTFLQSRNRVLSRDYLLQALSHVSSQRHHRSVDVCVSRLRFKLGGGRAGGADAIRTVRSEGYVFDCGDSTKAGPQA